MSLRLPPQATSPLYGVSSRPIAHFRSSVGVIAVSFSSTICRSVPAATSRIAALVARRALASCTVCCDCGSSSFQCHTSTLACGSVDSGFSASCSLRPTSSRAPSVLQRGAREFADHHPGREADALAGSNVAACTCGVPTLRQLRMTLSRCALSRALSPRSTARSAPSRSTRADRNRRSRSRASAARRWRAFIT